MTMTLLFIFRSVCGEGSPDDTLNTEDSDTPEPTLMPARKYKASVCLAMPFNQTISKKGCTSVMLLNHYCMGQCNSWYVPTGEETPFRTCSNCMPSDYERIRIVLSCPGRKKKFKIKNMLVVRECACRDGAC